jgi:hypothetical protein
MPRGGRTSSASAFPDGRSTPGGTLIAPLAVPTRVPFR